MGFIPVQKADAFIQEFRVNDIVVCRPPEIFPSRQVEGVIEIPGCATIDFTPVIFYARIPVGIISTNLRCSIRRGIIGDDDFKT